MDFAPCNDQFALDVDFNFSQEPSLFSNINLMGVEENEHDTSMDYLICAGTDEINSPSKRLKLSKDHPVHDLSENDKPRVVPQSTAVIDLTAEREPRVRFSDILAVREVARIRDLHPYDDDDTISIDSDDDDDDDDVDIVAVELD